MPTPPQIAPPPKHTPQIAPPCATPPHQPIAARYPPHCCAPASPCACSAQHLKPMPRAKKPAKPPTPQTPTSLRKKKAVAKPSITAAPQKKARQSAIGACTANAGADPMPALARDTPGDKAAADQAFSATGLRTLASARQWPHYRRHVFLFFRYSCLSSFAPLAEPAPNHARL